MLLLPLTHACKQETGVPHPGENAAGTIIRANESVSIWMTTGDKSKLLQQQGNVTFAADAGSNATTVTVDENSSFQNIDGYGFTLTQGSAQVISGLAAAQQDALLNELFSAGGIGISAIRISIGASDLSNSSYSYRDGASFSLAGPDLTYLIPMIKKVLAINPGIKILATPWSAPRWMKTNGGWVGGRLNAGNYGDYATYFVDYLNAMQAQGITIWGITPQNEPENGGNEPSMLMDAGEQLNFINNHLGPRIRGAGYNTKIIAFDHNCDNTNYPTTVANGSSYVDGSAFHLYLGNISAMTTVKNATNKNVYFTEQWTSSAGSFGGDLSWHTQNITVGASRNWAKAVFEWNLANNTSMGPRTPGGCTQCLGAITINSSTSYTRNVAYYIIAHLSKFVKPGAVRINSNIAGSIQNVAFKNSDGTKVLLAGNNGGSAVTFKVKWGSQSFTYTLPAGATATFKWSGTQSSGGTTAPIGQVISLRGINNQFVCGQNGTQAMRCDKAVAGDWERFTVVDAGAGKVALRSMSKYVSSENGAASGMTCTRTTVGDWEKFDWVVNADGKISLRGNNGMYVCSENGTDVMKCNRPSISGWEAFSLN
ncbi:glucan endo-1,6-beta-glucosidase [Pedobacter sp. HMF7056]|uniref:Glucan endo-1,6-beta-glucosidase n=2 Tax=Hufsiella ginkgonis TaxID=2695274 RepID=A0A7K1XVG7_9SPHI|nr:glucan endo-1,6-beta-glucosidase [Hufsiella ginkgonis]